MSSTNLDLVRSIYAGWERGDFKAGEWAHPEIQYSIADGLEPGSWTGVAAMEEANREWLSPFGEARVKAEEYRELDGERILVFDTVLARGIKSGVAVEQLPGRAATLFHIRDSRVVRIVSWWDGAHALAELGLAPESESSAS